MFFINKTNKLIIATNYKVMYSTLMKSKLYTLISTKKALAYLILNPHYQRLFLTRDPFTRLESFYKDKVILNYSKEKKQYCQVIIEQQLSITDLNKLQYQDFILNLEIYYKLDNHLTPQYYACNVRGFYIGGLFQKIEIDNHKVQLNDLLHINNQVVENPTPHMSFTYTENMKNLIQRLYEKDFYYLVE